VIAKNVSRSGCRSTQEALQHQGRGEAMHSVQQQSSGMRLASGHLLEASSVENPEAARRESVVARSAWEER
jgi:hypothetical protein